jgi:membrane fusion protein (multidrug efflux system)
VRARIDAGVRANGLLVPQRAVTVTPQGASVMVVGGKDVVESRPVKVGALEGGAWQIDSGLVAGERVIVDGLQKVQAGRTVKITAPSAPSPAPPAVPPAAAN